MQRSNLLRRLMALIYDLFLLIALLFAWIAAVIGVRVWLSSEEIVRQADTAAPAWAIYLGLIVVVGGFYSFFWRKSGQTLGMQAWRIKTQRQDGSALNFKDCVIRLVAGIPSWSCLGLGILWALGPKRLAWHDILSNTEVVLLAKESRKKD